MTAAEHVSMLHAMFPDVEADTISMVLESTSGDPDAAVELLLGMADGDAQPPAPPAPPTPLAPRAAQPQRLTVQVSPGMRAGQTIQFPGPGGGRFTATIPPGVPEGGTFMVDVATPAGPPLPTAYDQQLQQLGMTEDEQLARALAESIALSGRAEPRLAMAVAAEREAIRQTADDERARQRAPVASHMLRVAGDSRGTASTLVGLTPDEELELAVLKSAVAAEQGDQPPAPPPTWRPASTPGATPPAPSAFAQPPLAPLGPLPPMASMGPMAPLAPPPPAQPSKPPKRAAAGGALSEGLLGGDHLADLALAPLVMRPMMGARLGQQPPAAPSYQPPLLPTMAPATAPRRGGAADDDDEWDDVDRPLSGLLGGGGSQPETSQVKAGAGRSYAQLEDT